MVEGQRVEQHPSAAELERFLLGDLSPREAVPVIAHLLKGCALCREKMSPLAVTMFTPARSLPEPAPDAGAEYDFPLFKAFAAARHHAASLRREESEAERKVDALLLKEVPAAELPPRAVREQRDWARCEALLEHCWNLRDTDPESMVMMGTLAVAFAERLKKSEADPRAVADLRARAWGELGNARRVTDDFLGAEKALGHALEIFSQGTGDPLLLARLMDLTASLCTDRRRFREAFQLLDWVYAIYRAQGDSHAAGRALISKAISASRALNRDEAIRLHSQGLALVDPQRDPKLVLASVHGLVIDLVNFDRFEQAWTLLEESRPLYNLHGSPTDRLKASWVEGVIAAGLGEEDKAEQLFREVQQGFVALDKPCTAAMASLELATLWLNRGRTAEIKELVEEAVEILRAGNVRTEAVAALLVLREALQKEQATVALLRTVAAELQRMEREPVRPSRSEQA